MVRIYIPLARLQHDNVVETDAKQAHYLAHVMRLKQGDLVTLFNGKDGEWLAEITLVHKKFLSLVVQKQLRIQHSVPDITLVTSLLRNSKTELIVEKATELGVAAILPVTTRYTVASKINEERLNAIAIEAAEQCERLDVPLLHPLTPLEKLLGSWDKESLLLYGDESGKGGNAKEVLPALTAKKYAVLIGPEGGFAPEELDILRTLPFTKAICMGGRILRADTASIAALALVQSYLGDWEAKPDFRRQ